MSLERHPAALFNPAGMSWLNNGTDWQVLENPVLKSKKLSCFLSLLAPLGRRRLGEKGFSSRMSEEMEVS